VTIGVLLLLCCPSVGCCVTDFSGTHNSKTSLHALDFPMTVANSCVINNAGFCSTTVGQRKVQRSRGILESRGICGIRLKYTGLFPTSLLLPLLLLLLSVLLLCRLCVLARCVPDLVRAANWDSVSGFNFFDGAIKTARHDADCRDLQAILATISRCSSPNARENSILGLRMG
jgi:hypothetical protein